MNAVGLLLENHDIKHKSKNHVMNALFESHCTCGIANIRPLKKTVSHNPGIWLESLNGTSLAH